MQACPLVMEDGKCRPADGGGKGGVCKHDVGTFAAHFQGNPFQVACGGLYDLASCCRGTGKGDLVYIRMLGNVLSGYMSVTRDDIHNTGREADFIHEVNQSQRRQGCELRRFHHYGITGRPVQALTSNCKT